MPPPNWLRSGEYALRNLGAPSSRSENTIEAPRAARIEGAQRFRPIGQVADAAAELASFGRIRVEELRGAFVLAHLHMAIVGDDGDQPVVADLVHVIGGRENTGGANLGDRFRVVGLVACVAESGKTEFVLDPFAEGTRSVRLPAGAGLSCEPRGCFRCGEGRSERDHELSAVNGHGV